MAANKKLVMLLACLLQLFSAALGDTSQCSTITVNGDDLDTISVWTDGVTSRLAIAKPSPNATASPLTAKTASMMKCSSDCSFPLLTYVTSIGSQSSFLHIQEPLSFLVPNYFTRYPSNESIRCVPYPGYCGAFVPLYRHFRVTSFGIQHAYSFSADVSFQDFNVEGNPVCYFWQSNIVAADPPSALPNILPSELSLLHYFDNHQAGTMEDHYATTLSSVPGYTEISPLGKVATNTSASCDELIALVQMVDNQTGAFARLDHKLVLDGQESNRLFEQYTALPEKIYCTARPVCGATVPLWKLFDYVDLDSMYATSPTTSPNTYLYPNAPLCYIWEVGYGEAVEVTTQPGGVIIPVTSILTTTIGVWANATGPTEMTNTTVQGTGATTLPSNATTAGGTTAASNSTVEVTTVSSANSTVSSITTVHSPVENSTAISSQGTTVVSANATQGPTGTTISSNFSEATTAHSPVENSTALPLNSTVSSTPMNSTMSPISSTVSITTPALSPVETNATTTTVLHSTTVMPINIIEESQAPANITSSPVNGTTSTPLIANVTAPSVAPINGTTVTSITTALPALNSTGLTGGFTSSNVTWEQLFSTTVSSGSTTAGVANSTGSMATTVIPAMNLTEIGGTTALPIVNATVSGSVGTTVASGSGSTTVIPAMNLTEIGGTTVLPIVNATMSGSQSTTAVFGSTPALNIASTTTVNGHILTGLPAATTTAPLGTTIALGNGTLIASTTMISPVNLTEIGGTTALPIVNTTGSGFVGTTVASGSGSTTVIPTVNLTEIGGTTALPIMNATMSGSQSTTAVSGSGTTVILAVNLTEIGGTTALTGNVTSPSATTVIPAVNLTEIGGTTLPSTPAMDSPVSTTTIGHILTGPPETTIVGTTLPAGVSTPFSGTTLPHMTTTGSPAFTMQFPGSSTPFLGTTVASTGTMAGATTGITSALGGSTVPPVTSTGWMLQTTSLPTSFIDIIENMRSTTVPTGLTTSMGNANQTTSGTLPIGVSTPFLGTTTVASTGIMAGETTIHPTGVTLGGSTVISGVEATTSVGGTTVASTGSTPAHDSASGSTVLVGGTTVASVGSTISNGMTTMMGQLGTSSGMETTTGHEVMESTVEGMTTVTMTSHPTGETVGSTISGGLGTTVMASHNSAGSTVAVEGSTVPSNGMTTMEGSAGHVTTVSGVEGTTVTSHGGETTALPIGSTATEGTTLPTPAHDPVAATTMGQSIGTTVAASHGSAGSTVMVEGSTVPSSVMTTMMGHVETTSAGMTPGHEVMATTGLLIASLPTVSGVEGTTAAVHGGSTVMGSTAGGMETTVLAHDVPATTMMSHESTSIGTTMATPAHDSAVTSLPETTSTGHGVMSSTIAEPAHDMPVTGPTTTHVFTANTILWEHLFPTQTTVGSTVEGTTTRHGETTMGTTAVHDGATTAAGHGGEATTVLHDGTTIVQGGITAAPIETTTIAGGHASTVVAETTLAHGVETTVIPTTHAPLASATPGNFFGNVTMPTVPSWAGHSG